MVLKPECKQESLNSWWKCQFSGRSPRFYESVGPVWGLAVEQIFNRHLMIPLQVWWRPHFEKHCSRRELWQQKVQRAEGARQPLASVRGYSWARALLTRVSPSEVGGAEHSLETDSVTGSPSLSSLGYHLVTYQGCKVVIHLLGCLTGQSVKPSVNSRFYPLRHKSPGEQGWRQIHGAGTRLTQNGFVNRQNRMPPFSCDRCVCSQIPRLLIKVSSWWPFFASLPETTRWFWIPGGTKTRALVATPSPHKYQQFRAACDEWVCLPVSSLSTFLPFLWNSSV